jgi:glycosyltransferase involved in cell wall biosynthesis
MIIGIDTHDLEGRPTGVGRVLINLLRQWDSFDLPSDLKFILYFKKEIPNLDLSECFEKKLLGSKSNALFIHWFLPRAAQKDKVDILFCPGYVGPVYYRGKIALILHDIIYQARPELYNWPSVWDKILLKWVSRKAAQKAKIILTPSEFSKQEILRCYQVRPEKVFSIPLAVDESFQQINDPDKLAEVKRRYQIKDKFILSVGSIFNRRHLPEVIKAFEKVAQKLTNYQFLIIGQNYTNQRLFGRAILHQDYLKGRDLNVLYNAADLLVWLSDYEGFGLPVLEAMACGTPVVTSPLGSIPEVAGEAAIYVQDNSNVQEISQAIYQGLTDEDLRQKLIAGGLAQAKKFSWQRCARSTLDALLSIR